MKPFAYERPTTVDEALALVADGGTFLAGGTNLVDHLRLGIAEADRLVDITRLPLDEVTERPDGGLVIGAGVRNSDLAAHPLVRTRLPFCRHGRFSKKASSTGLPIVGTTSARSRKRLKRSHEHSAM